MPTYLITAPDGRKFNVTGDGTAEEALAHIQQMAGGAPEATPQPPPQPISQGDFNTRFRGEQDRGVVDAALRGAADTASFGFGDEISAGIRSGAGLWGDYGKELEAVRARNEQAAQDHPIATVAGNVAGAVPSMLVPGTGVARGVGLGAKIVRGALGGAATGAAYGFGSGEGGLDNRVASAENSAMVGGGLGALAPAAGRVVAKTVGARAGRAAVPATSEIKDASQRLYQAADKEGLLINPKSFDRAIDTIALEMRSKGIDSTIHPKATAALDRLTKAKGTTNSLQDVETLRRVIGQAAQSTDPAERYMAGKMIDRLDRYMTDLKPSDVIAGPNGKADPSRALGIIKEARDLWKTKAKGDILADLYQRAELSPTGLENGLRTEFRNLAKNAKKMRGFTPAEQKEIRKIAMGGSLQTILRVIGKAAPTGIVSGGGSVGTGALVGGLVGGPAGAAVGAAVSPALGAAGRKAATAMKKGQFNRLDATVRNGGVKPFDKAVADRAQTYSEVLLGAGGRALLPHQPLKLFVPSGTPVR